MRGENSGSDGVTLKNHWLHHEWHTGLIHTVAQNLLGAGMTFSAACTKLKVLSQLSHGAHAIINRLADTTVRNIVADANNHGMGFLQITT